MKRIVTLLVCAGAFASGSRTFRLSSFSDFDAGEPDGTSIGSQGEVRRGWGKTRISVDAQSVWCAAQAPDGSLWLGTGDEARVLRLHDGKITEFAHLEGLLVTAISVAGNVIYASTVPGGRVYAILPTGQARLFSELKADHVWALSFDVGTKTLYAATGPKGQLFAIDTQGHARVHFDSQQKHLLALVPDGDGGLYVGSSEEAIVYHVARSGLSFAIHDFSGNEVRALVRDRSGALYAAVNEFEKGGTGNLPPPGEKTAAGGTAPPQPPPQPRPAAAKGKSLLARIERDGTVEPLLVLPNATIHGLDVDPDGSVWVTTAPEGRVFLVTPNDQTYTILDLDEKQALMVAKGHGGRVVGTSDGAAVYTISKEVAVDAIYRSKALDANYVSDWGEVRFRAGKEVELEARSGNTEKPDAGWSNWVKVQGTHGAGITVGKLRCPSARYLQLRAGFPKDSTSALREIVAYYQPRNQRVRVSEIVRVEAQPEPGPSGPQQATPTQPAHVVKLRWKTENPDGDTLIFRLWFREESEVTWRPLGGVEPLEKNEFDWDTESIADGTYRIKVLASDERSNVSAKKTVYTMISDPILVDNRKPEVLGLAVNGRIVSGRAVDTYSPIEKLEYSIDGDRWVPLGSLDGVLDSTSEPFRVELDNDLAPGPHTAAVRAIDAGGNTGVTQIPLRLP